MEIEISRPELKELLKTWGLCPDCNAPIDRIVYGRTVNKFKPAYYIRIWYRCLNIHVGDDGEGSRGGGE